MKEVLEETHGVMVYQEQVMRILNRLGGIELADAYTCIKAISKKKLAMIAKFREEFIDGAVEQGPGQAARPSELFEHDREVRRLRLQQEPSTAYALIAYKTAYLKAHYPVEFMAALLSGDIPGRNFKKKDSLVEHLEDCRRMDIEVVPPDVNRSEVDFTVADGKILLRPVRDQGLRQRRRPRRSSPARKQDGPFRSLFDFCERVDPQQRAAAATIETLIKAGAFDSLRRQACAVDGRASTGPCKSGAAVLADRRSGQKGLFDDDDDDQPRAAAASAARRARVGRTRASWRWKRKCSASISRAIRWPSTKRRCERTARTRRSQLAKLDASHRSGLGGMLAAIKFSHTKNPRPGSTHTKYAMFDLEDIDGIVRCILWPEQFAEFGQLVEGRRDPGRARRRSTAGRAAKKSNLIVNELIPLDELPARFTNGVVIRVREDAHGVDMLTPLREIVRGYPGHEAAASCGSTWPTAAA